MHSKSSGFVDRQIPHTYGYATTAFFNCRRNVILVSQGATLDHHPMVSLEMIIIDTAWKGKTFQKEGQKSQSKVSRTYSFVTDAK